VNAVQLILYFFLGPETRYIRGTAATHIGSSFRQQYLNFRRIDPTPFHLADFFHPLTLVTRHRIFLPAAAYAMVFSFASILTTVMIPQIYEQKFALNTQQIGLQFLAVIVGSIIGEQIGGLMSDRWMRMRDLHKVRPEFRLWLAYPGYLLAICGVVVFLIQFDHATPGQWNITPTVGAGIAAAGNQIVTTVLITYAVDCHREEAASIGVFVTFVRQIWGFIGPFW
jgi:MFS family permease